ncbi:hypothetical protein DESC_750005 [Desulfosarcina cetonica]|nr:hypothetical protein DESC_750005 [Desulfosarcina cetonica]
MVVNGFRLCGHRFGMRADRRIGRVATGQAQAGGSHARATGGTGGHMADLVGLIADGQRAGAKTGNKGDDHAGKRSKRKPLYQAGALDLFHPGSPGTGQLTHRAPAHRYGTQQSPNHAFDLPDAEKGGPVVNGRCENAFHPTADAGKGITVQESDKDAILGHPEGFFQRLLGVVDKLEAGKQAGMIKGVVVKGQVLGHAAVQGYAIAQSFRQNVQHVGRWIDAGDLEPFFQKRQTRCSGAAADIQDRFSGCRIQHAQHETAFQIGGKAVLALEEPLIVVLGILKVVNVAHGNNRSSHPKGVAGRNRQY